MKTVDRWKKITALFDGALEQPEARRAEWLATASDGDEDARAEVERMLAAHGIAGGILDHPTFTMSPTDFQEDDGPQAGSAVAGRYRVLREVGRGGMGVVYEAHDPRLDRRIALKFLPPRAGTEAKARFLAEAKTASAIDHPNICTVYDAGDTDDGRLWIAMAFYDGETVAQRLRKGPFSVDESIRVASHVLRGLECAHGAGIVHRDIKPSNIMLTARGEVKILDFGVAKLAHESPETRPGTKIGTAAYMSPEQARGEVVDHRTDLWSLCVVMCEMLSGQRLFRGDHEVSVMHAILYDEPPTPSLPGGLERIVRKALARERAERYAGAAAMLADLERFLDPGVGPAARLPAQLTSFIGREREIEQIGGLLSTARLLTLTGPGGAGKTRLALKAATQLAEKFEGSVVFVPLAAINDPDLVAPAMAQVVCSQRSPGLGAVDELRFALRDRKALLVLDNFEQVAAAAPVVAELLAACPEVKMVVTSRVPLRLTCEHEFPVPPLPLPLRGDPPDPRTLERNPAVALFVDRARATRPDFALTAENAADIAELCARLDGLPLAIELAAARVKMFPPHAMLERLCHRLDFLKTDQKDRPARHQTIRQAISYSYDLLNEPEQRLFRRLAVFVNGLTLDAAAALANAGGSLELDVEEGIAGLVDHSLLRRSDDAGKEPRFHMLEIVRDYALERLEERERESAREAHALHFLALAERADPLLTGSMQVEWMDRLEAEHDNLRAAIAWAEEKGEAEEGLRIGAALWRFWLVRGHLSEGRRKLDQLLALPGKGSSLVRARALNGVGTLAHNNGENGEARVFLEEALLLFRQAGDQRGVASVLGNLGWVACELTDLEAAETLSTEALELNRELGEKRGCALALNNLGWVATYRSEYHGAVAYQEESLALRQEIGDSRGVAFTLSNISWAEMCLGDYVRAETLADRALEMLRELHDRSILGWALVIRGWIASEKGEHERAAGFVEECYRLAREAGNRSIRAAGLTGLGILATVRGEHERAVSLFEEAISLWQAIGGRWGVARSLHGRASALHGTGDASKALSDFRTSLRMRSEIGDRRGIAGCLEGIAGIEAEQHRLRNSARLLGGAAKLRETATTPVPPYLRSELEQVTEKARAGLGAGEFDAAWTEGREAPIDALVRSYLEEA